MPNDDSVKAKAERLRRHVRDLGPSPSRFVQDADACAVAVLAHEQEREADGVRLKLAQAQAEIFYCCGGSDEDPPEHTQDCSLVLARRIVADEWDEWDGATEDMAKSYIATHEHCIALKHERGAALKEVAWSLASDDPHDWRKGLEILGTRLGGYKPANSEREALAEVEAAARSVASMPRSAESIRRCVQSIAKLDEVRKNGR